MKIQKIKGSTLVLVLIILFVAAILMLFTMSAVVYQSKVVKTQQQKNTADLLADSALNILTSRFLANPKNFLSNMGDEVSLVDLGVCEPHAAEIQKKCNSNSKVLIKKLKYILAYRLKHGETIQVNLASKSATPTLNGIDIIFSNPSSDSSVDRLLVTGYYYKNPGSSSAELKPTGACIISYKSSILDVSCTGKMNITEKQVLNGKEYFGDNRVYVEFKEHGSSSYLRPHFIRIKGIYSNNSKETWVSVTGPNYSDLPLPQEVVLKASVYSYDAKGEEVRSKMVKTLFVHPEMPEVMDWVFYNGANSSVLK